jgi:alpha-L-fucosidase
LPCERIEIRVPGDGRFNKSDTFEEAEIMYFRTIVLGLVLAVCGAWPLSAAEPDWNRETKSQRDARMKWWRDARFGMFVHWGLYAIPAGTWNGEQLPGVGEWIMDRANIPVDQYEKLAGHFNPVKYDPAKWARIAKGAGMRYLVITSKHHDGFCLFATDTTDYDVVDATPYGKDLLKPLAEECRKHGLRFCTYYSIMDWHHPAQERADERHYNPTRIREGRKPEYMAYMKQQLRDLLASCDPDVLWFDGEWPAWYTEEDGREIYAFLRNLKPEIIINNRVGKGRKGMEGLSKGDEYVGDFGTPEQQIPATGLPGVDWESCMTMNDTWGYKSFDQNWKSAETLIRNLIDIASKGGNYLLNVGPTAEGEIPAPSVERLAAIGRWMDINGESIYGTQASPFETTPWGRCTQKSTDGKSRLYLHVFQWPEDNRLLVPQLPGEPAAAMLLDGGRSLNFARRDGGINIVLPAHAPDPTATVVVLDRK